MKLLDIIIWILIIISIIVVSWYIFGSSPTLEQSLLVLIISMLFIIHSKSIKNEATLSYLKNRFSKIEDSFIKLADDFREHIKKNK